MYRGKLKTWSQRKCERCKKFIPNTNKFCKECAKNQLRGQLKASNLIVNSIRKYNDIVIREAVGLPIPFIVREKLR